MSYSFLFLKLVSSKEVHICFAKRWTWRLKLWELHQQDFRATNVVDWEGCFANKTVETYIFLSLMSYSFNIYLNYINKLLMTKILHGSLDGIGTVLSNEKKKMLEYVRPGVFLFDSPIYLKMDVVANLIFSIHMRIIVIVIIATSWSDHNSQ